MRGGNRGAPWMLSTRNHRFRAHGAPPEWEASLRERETGKTAITAALRNTFIRLTVLTSGSRIANTKCDLQFVPGE